MYLPPLQALEWQSLNDTDTTLPLCSLDSSLVKQKSGTTLADVEEGRPPSAPTPAPPSLENGGAVAHHVADVMLPWGQQQTQQASPLVSSSVCSRGKR